MCFGSVYEDSEQKYAWEEIEINGLELVAVVLCMQLWEFENKFFNQLGASVKSII